MGVYIKGMTMPKNCYGCPFFTQVDYWNKNDEADILSKCKRTGAFTWESVDVYLPNCPLGPVPPHGRLIEEADAIETAWMILRGLGYLKEENPKLEQTVREVFATAPAIEVE